MPSHVTFDLSGQTAFITGATSGFGARFAEVLSNAGAKVVITGRRVERLHALKARIENRGGHVVALPIDVTDVSGVRACVEAAEKEAGPIAILVNNAGLNVQASASALSEADYDTIMDTNALRVRSSSRRPWAGAWSIARCRGASSISRRSARSRRFPGSSPTACRRRRSR